MCVVEDSPAAKSELLPQLQADLQSLGERLSKLSDEEVGSVLLGTPALDNFLAGIFDRAWSKGHLMSETVARHKHRLQVMAAIRHVVTRNATLTAEVNGRRVCISPHHQQWRDDGFIYTEGEHPFAGLLELYRPGDDTVWAAIATRDIDAGQEFDPSDVMDFVPLEEFKKRPLPVLPSSEGDLDVPARELGDLLDSGANDEAVYQELLSRHSWVLGLEYEKIFRHDRLDNENIPDFMGVRVRDQKRDVIEIKPPFMALTRSDGEWSQDFLRAWDQAERYLHFCRTQRAYLRDKGLNFENAICILVLGHNLDERTRAKLRAKESMNAALRVFTYEDLAAYVRSTAAFVKRARTGSSPL
jgi:hypothetical protein